MQIKQKKIIVIGCFYMHKNSEQVILGSILAKIQYQDDRNEQVIAALDRANNLQPNWFELLRNLFMCQTRRERCVC
jgi:hypothetical protein